tara:strand:+ start:8137 stop:8808 length:672 start_codon:yes stop_codon:yes gene_type:complete
LKKQLTNKLFYNKYLYSLNCINPMTAIFRNKNFRFAKSVIDNMQNDYHQGLPLYLQRARRKKEINLDDFNDIKILFNEFSRSQEEYKIRCQGNNFIIYSNNKNWLQLIQSKIKSAKEFFEPDPKYVDFLLNNTHTLIVENTDYAYKCCFSNNKIPESFATWCEKNRNKIKITDNALNDIKLFGSAHGRTCYVKDDSILMLCNLIAGTIFNRIDKLVCRQNIDK